MLKTHMVLAREKLLTSAWFIKAYKKDKTSLSLTHKKLVYQSKTHQSSLDYPFLRQNIVSYVSSRWACQWVEEIHHTRDNYL